MFQNFQQAEEFLASRKSLGIKPGLERMQALLQRLDHPEKNIRAIHIAGTNGKGSTIQFLKNALRANGYNVGVFSSPSLEGLLGHIYHNDSPVDEDIFIQLCNQIYPDITQLDQKGISPTEFEIITVLAFMYFSDYVDIALIEAGMGGRQDTTNCIHPIFSIITNVSIDHTKFLGSSISEIAYHKAGIIKRNRPVIAGEIAADAFLQVKKEAQKLGAPFYQLGRDFIYEKLPGTKDKQQFIWNKKHRLEISMQGEHQIKNAAIAFMAITLLKEMKYKINRPKTVKAFSKTQAPGRFEVIQNNPPLILDGAHNTAGIESFLDTVLSVNSDRNRHLIFAVFKDKELRKMLYLLLPHFVSITLTTFDHPRAAALEDLEHFTKEENVFLAEDWKTVMKNVNENNAVYFVTGSLEFISRVRKYFLTD